MSSDFHDRSNSGADSSRSNGTLKISVINGPRLELVGDQVTLTRRSHRAQKKSRDNNVLTFSVHDLAGIAYRRPKGMKQPRGYFTFLFLGDEPEKWDEDREEILRADPHTLGVPSANRRDFDHLVARLIEVNPELRINDPVEGRTDLDGEHHGSTSNGVRRPLRPAIGKDSTRFQLAGDDVIISWKSQKAQDRHGGEASVKFSIFDLSAVEYHPSNKFLQEGSISFIFPEDSVRRWVERRIKNLEADPYTVVFSGWCGKTSRRSLTGFLK